MNPAGLAKILASLIAMLGPAPADMPKELQLKPGDQIIAIGDSITQDGGYLRDVDMVLASEYPELKLPKIVNVGISGQKAEDLLPRFKRDVVDWKPMLNKSDKQAVDRKPKWVTISIGINDVWHRLGQPHDPKVLEKYSENVAKMVDMAQAAGIKVILLSPTVIQEDATQEGNKRLLMYIAAEKKIAEEKKCEFVDLHQMFFDVLAKKPADFKDKWLTRDGVHMQARGDGLMALGILRALGVPDAKSAGAAPAASK
jgi:lysophospholipase L1-like esterase